MSEMPPWGMRTRPTVRRSTPPSDTTQWAVTAAPRTKVSPCGYPPSGMDPTSGHRDWPGRDYRIVTVDARDPEARRRS